METTVGIVFSNATVDISRLPPPERINGVKNVRPNTAIVLTHRDNARRITRRSRISCHITSLSLFAPANLFDFFRFPSCDASVFNTRNFCSSSCKNPLQLFGLVGSTLKPNMARRKKGMAFTRNRVCQGYKEVDPDCFAARNRINAAPGPPISCPIGPPKLKDCAQAFAKFLP